MKKDVTGFVAGTAAMRLILVGSYDNNTARIILFLNKIIINTR